MYLRHLMHRKPTYRAANFFFSRWIVPQAIDELLDKYSQRTNSIKLFGIAMAGFWVGTLLYYGHYKITV